MVTLNSSSVQTVRPQPIYYSAAAPVQTDEHLMIQAQQRNIGALEMLCDRYAEAGMDLAIRILGDRALAAQVLVRAFWHIWGHPHEYLWTRGSFSELFSGLIWHLSLEELDRRTMRPL